MISSRLEPLLEISAGHKEAYSQETVHWTRSVGARSISLVSLACYARMPPEENERECV